MKKGLSSFDLKIIAILAMTVDHIGYVLFPSVLVFRIIGRLTIPIITLLIAEGYFYTKDKNKYLSRLLIFALISQVPYMLVIENNFNVLFNYFFTLLMFRIWETSKDKVIALAFISVIIPLILLSEWSWYALAMIIGFTLFRKSKIKRIATLIVIIISMIIERILKAGHINSIILVSCLTLAIPFIYLYNEKRGKSLKYLFYIYYPVHLLILFFIQRLI